ncbi:MAG: DUF1254 domain-containing protein [Chloroflexi bacterium]|nr:DUF1254 domain-containing protein [Chloroflexota bacterium]
MTQLAAPDRFATSSGLPAPEAIDAVYDQRDQAAASLLYLWGLPIVAMAQWEQAHRQVLGGTDVDLGAYVSFDERLGILTPNTVTPYYVGFVDLSRTRPVVVDFPAGPTAAGASDFWQRHITDMGQTGPDRARAAGICSSARASSLHRPTAAMCLGRAPTTSSTGCGC